MGGLSCFSEWTQYNHRGQSLREKRFGTEAEVRDKGRWSAAVLRMEEGAASQGIQVDPGAGKAREWILS